MNNRVFATIGLVTGLLFNTPSIYAAADTGADYEVEVLVFKNLAPDQDGKEIWTPDRVNLVLPELDKAGEAATSADDKSVLGQAVEKLTESPNYQVISHKKWKQTAEAKSTSPLMRISTEDGELDGTFVFYMSRFLHIDLALLLKDLEQSDKLAAETASRNEAAGTTTVPGRPTDTAVNTIMAYRIEESRRIKSTELHYFDHPRFGVLVKVTPVEQKS